MSQHPYWFTYPYFKSTDKRVNLGIGGTDSGTPVFMGISFFKLVTVLTLKNSQNQRLKIYKWRHITSYLGVQYMSLL